MILYLLLAVQSSKEKFEALIAQRPALMNQAISTLELSETQARDRLLQEEVLQTTNLVQEQERLYAHAYEEEIGNQVNILKKVMPHFININIPEKPRLCLPSQIDLGDQVEAWSTHLAINNFYRSLVESGFQHCEPFYIVKESTDKKLFILRIYEQQGEVFLATPMLVCERKERYGDTEVYLYKALNEGAPIESRDFIKNIIFSTRTFIPGGMIGVTLKEIEGFIFKYLESLPDNFPDDFSDDLDALALFISKNPDLQDSIFGKLPMTIERQANAIRVKVKEILGAQEHFKDRARETQAGTDL